METTEVKNKSLRVVADPKNTLLVDFDHYAIYPVIANYSVTTDKLAYGSVTREKLALDINIPKLVSTTVSDYAALTTKDSNTLYCIPEE